MFVLRLTQFVSAAIKLRRITLHRAAPSTCGINKVHDGLKWCGPCFYENCQGWRCGSKTLRKTLSHPPTHQIVRGSSASLSPSLTPYRECMRKLRSKILSAVMIYCGRAAIGGLITWNLKRAKRHSALQSKKEPVLRCRANGSLLCAAARWGFKPPHRRLRWMIKEDANYGLD